MRIALDVTISYRAELELWRAGYKVPIRAAHKESDEDWIHRALYAGCQVVITRDKGLCDRAHRVGMHTILLMPDEPIPGLPPSAVLARQIQIILDAMEKFEEQYAEATRHGS